MFTNVTGGQVVEAQSSSCGVSFFSGLLANSTVTQANVMFTGGIVHVIDNVLTIPASVSETALDAGLSSLIGAVTQAGLAAGIDELPDITLFAPSNAAFQAVGSAFTGASVDLLGSVLEYHVINGTVAYSADLTNTTVPSLNGNDLTITVGADGSIFVNQARVIIPNVIVANGVVHVIDG